MILAGIPRPQFRDLICLAVFFGAALAGAL